MTDRRLRPRIARPPRPSPGPTAGEATQPAPQAVARRRGSKREDSSAHRPSRELGASVIGRVLILDEDSAAASNLADALAMDGHAVELRPNVTDGIAAVAKIAPDVVVVDPWSGDGDFQSGSDVIDKLRLVRDHNGASPEIVVVTSRHDVDSAVDALHRGASDYIVKPTSPGRLRLAIARALERLRLLNENGRLRHDLALFAAGQRILETLDAHKLASYGLDALCSFARAAAGVVVHGEKIMAERGLSEAECLALARLPRPVNFTDRVQLSGPVLGRFAQALVLDLDDNRAAVLVSGGSFDAATEESGLFLARQLQTAFRTGVRFADAEREARRDSLTGLWNAKAFQEAVILLTGKPDALPFSVLFLDVDHFKSVNDRHGHVAGSHALVDVAEVLQSCLREGDLTARYGGDEFTVLLPEVDTEVALKVAERIRATIATHRFEVGSSIILPITVCIGVASFPRHARDAQAILDMADRAMYIGKGSIRNSVHVAEIPP